MLWSATVALALFFLSATATATLSVSDGKLQRVDAVSASLISSLPFSSSSRLALQQTDILRLAFTVNRDGHPFRPQQASLVVQPVPPSSEAAAHSAQFPIKVRPQSGKAKYDLDLSSSSASSPLNRLAALSPDRTLALTLVVGHPHEPEPVHLALAHVQWPEQALTTTPPSSSEPPLPPHWHAEKYAPQPEIEWTFRPGENRINPLVALAGLALVLAPWLVLFTTVPRLVRSVVPPSGRTTLFLVALVALELLSVVSWVYFLPVTTTLPYFAAIGVATVGTGRAALAEMAAARKRTTLNVPAAKKQL
ncbi:hypothetical protein JCM3774_002686 [Rhodotorula dairenensis]